jgi:hypothetical protein
MDTLTVFPFVTPPFKTASSFSEPARTNGNAVDPDNYHATLEAIYIFKTGNVRGRLIAAMHLLSFL